MANITAADVNKLRTITGAGMMDCKKALVEAEGDFDLAIENLRKKGQKVAANRSDRESTEGAAVAVINADNTAGVAITLNCETDFVGKNESFVKNVWIDNPDQRIQSDIDSYCSSASEFLVNGFIQSVAVIFAILYIIYSGMHISVFLIIFSWPLLNLVIFRIIMPPITKNIYKMDEHEGYFRYAHARLREYAESMVFFRADEKERTYIESTLGKLIRIIKGLGLKYFPLTTYTSVLERMPQVSIFMWLYLAVILNWGPFVPGLSPAEMQNEASKWFMYIQNVTDAWYGLFALSFVFTQLTGNAHRIAEMIEVCDRVEIEAEENAGDVGGDPEKVKVVNLTVFTPTNKVLVKNLNFTVIFRRLKNTF